jgi:hypothetical protein
MGRAGPETPVDRPPAALGPVALCESCGFCGGGLVRVACRGFSARASSAEPPGQAPHGTETFPEKPCNSGKSLIKKKIPTELLTGGFGGTKPKKIYPSVGERARGQVSISQ